MIFRKIHKRSKTEARRNYSKWQTRIAANPEKMVAVKCWFIPFDKAFF